MTLSEYLNETGTSQRSFAEAVGASPSYINEIVNGLKIPGTLLAVRIEEVSGGRVPARVWASVASEISRKLATGLLPVADTIRPENASDKLGNPDRGATQ